MSANHDRLKRKAIEARLPLDGAFELTPLCNFKCKMCYVRQDPEQVRSRGGLRPADFWLKTAEEARDAGCLYPLITGGEPFTYPGFRGLYEQMHRMGLQCSINSNGSLIDERAVDWLVQSPPARINLTLYGGSAETYGRLCGDPDAFARVLHAADLMREAGILFRFNCSLTPDNACDFDKILEIAGRYGKSVRIATYMFPSLRGRGEIGTNSARFAPDEAAYYEVKMDFCQLEPEQFRLLAKNGQRYIEPTDAQLAAADAGEPGESHCMAGRCSFWIDWRGNMSGCGVNMRPHFSLDEYGFAEAWKRVVDYTESFRWSPACNNCANASVCFSCPAMAYNETGSFDGRPAYLCEKAKYAAKWYRHFLEQLPEADEAAPEAEPAGESVSDCPVDDF